MPNCHPLNNYLCVALDVDTRQEVDRLVDQLADLVGGFKLGPRLIHRYGQSIVQDLAVRAPVFVDCKFFDIPSTMFAAVRASFEAGASLVTVHALSGYECLSKLAELEHELSQQRPFRILAVTILTSWSQKSFPSNFKDQTVQQHVLELAQLVKISGLKSVVCSPEEISLLSGLGMYLLTPGIRLPDSEKGDQVRVLDPQAAIQLGASALVVGRPIIGANSPREMAKKYQVSF